MDLWVFDNDGTLYDDSKVGDSFMKISLNYFSEVLSLPPQVLEDIIPSLKRKWNTDFLILALTKEYNLNFSESVRQTYLKIDLEECGVINSDIRNLLDSISSPKVVLTNNPSSFANKILTRLSLDTSFIDIIGMEETNFVGKPHPEAYQTVLNRHKGFEQIFFCDDSIQNLDAALQFGWKTIWLKPIDAEIPNNTSHLTINSFEELRFHLEV